MKALEALQQNLATEFALKKGKTSKISLSPPVSLADLQKIETAVGCAFPDEVREFFLFCGGFKFRSYTEQPDQIFLEVCGLEQVFPHALTIACDDCGNCWVIDIAGGNSDDAPVFYACHDPPVIVFQAESLGAFLQQIFQLADPSQPSEIVQVYDDHSWRIWTKFDGAITHSEALGGDSELQNFARSLDDTYLFVDLRNPSIGQGFSWGRYGDTVVKRHSSSRIFAYQMKKLTWIQKIFGV